MRSFTPVDEREVREAGNAGSDQLQRDAETRRIVAALNVRQQVILLDQDGDSWSSEELAEQVSAWREDGRDRAVVIGGANGVTDLLRQRATASWSLGPLTLPHELARVIVLEQLYRAGTILRGEPYHKGIR
jgi:23S rRNA (pseudouridine1915-N3)-methyltransferase